uniref:Glutaredoxin-like protein n=1 Tax=Amphiprion ocellaris TaxID=80972 RepID=A0AAQ5XR64_AMPOC
MFALKTLCRPAALQLLRLFSTKTLPTLTLFTKFILQQVDISLPENKLWWDKYKWDIPVFHLEGRYAMKHRVDMTLLDKLLQDIETQKT